MPTRAMVFFPGVVERRWSFAMDSGVESLVKSRTSAAFCGTKNSSGSAGDNVEESGVDEESWSGVEVCAPGYILGVDELVDAVMDPALFCWSLDG